MSEDILGKAKRKRKLQANVIINLNKPLNYQALQAVEDALARDHARSEDDSVGKGSKKRPRRIGDTYHITACPTGEHMAGGGATPQHAAAESCVEAQATKGLEYRGSVVGTGTDANATSRPVTAHSIGNDVPQQYNRLSEPLSSGHAAESVQNHGVGMGRNQNIAVQHVDLQQSSTVARALTTMHSVNGDAVNDGGSRNITRPTGNVLVQALNAAGEAGRYGGMHKPAVTPVRPDSHTARDGASNGTHSLGTPACPPRDSMKASPLDIMKATQQRMG